MAASRSRDARKLEQQLLREHTGTEVQLVYNGPPSKDRHGRAWDGWSIDWWNGPLPDRHRLTPAEQRPFMSCQFQRLVTPWQVVKIGKCYLRWSV
jgi:hypothetical protein